MVVGLVGLFAGNATTIAGPPPAPNIVVDVNFPSCDTAAYDTTSIADAIAHANPADVIYVCPSLSPYVEPLITVNVGSLKILGPSANGHPGVATVKRSSIGPSGIVFDVTADSVVIRGLDIDATPAAGHVGATIGVQVTGSYGEVSDSTIHSSLGGSGVNVDNAIDVTIQRNYFSLGDRALDCYCDFSYILNNTFDHQTSNTAVLAYGNSITLQGNMSTGNTISVGSTSGLIDGNTIDGTGNGGNSLLLARGDPLTVSNNTLKNSTTEGLTLPDNALTSGTNATVIKNTFDSVATGILMLQQNSLFPVIATIGGTAANANHFINSGDMSVQAIGSGQLLYLSGVPADIDARYNDWGRCSLAAIENVVHHHPDDANLGTVDYDPFILGPTCATPTPTPTPSPTPSTSPTPSNTPGPTSSPRIQGDLNCSGSITGADGLPPLLKAAGIAPNPPPDCSHLGDGSPEFGDVNCDGEEDVADTVAILQHAAGLPIKPPQPNGCTPLGEQLPA